MNIIKLDASHRCVLKHWEEIKKMNDCRDQVETRLKEFALRVCGALHSKHQGDFEREESLAKQGWFQMNSTRLKNWKNAGDSLLTLGVQGISAENLLHLDGDGSDPPLFYVYSPYRAGAVNDISTNQLVSIVPPPPGFEPKPDVPGRGYVFTKELPALTPEEICDSTKLEQYFTDPLATLIEWYKANESTILKAFGESRREKS